MILYIIISKQVLINTVLNPCKSFCATSGVDVCKTNCYIWYLSVVCNKKLYVECSESFIR